MHPSSTGIYSNPLRTVRKKFPAQHKISPLALLATYTEAVVMNEIFVFIVSAFKISTFMRCMFKIWPFE